MLTQKMSRYWITPRLFILALSVKLGMAIEETKIKPANENDTVISPLKIVEDRAKKVMNAIQFGINSTRDLIDVQEPVWYQMGLFLNENHPASKVALFGKPSNRKVQELARFGFAQLEATKKIFETFPQELSRKRESPFPHQNRQNCPFNRIPRCRPASKRYRTADGTCNNVQNPWKGSSIKPMQRFLPPVYEDGIQSVRRSVLGPSLPSPREISQIIHRDKNKEMESLTLMFVQWGQFVDHDITSTVKSRGFNGSVPRCCDQDGRDFLPKNLMHPSCLPIEISDEDWLFQRFGVKCMEFIRSAPSTSINCDFGWREQINQVTSYLDASVVYGSDVETSDSIRTFKNGKIFYGSFENFREQELCHLGALSTNCFQPGDGRVNEQPGLIALHSIWIKLHNKIATTLSRHNPHWSDERLFQETRKIIYSFIQHITYNEFLPTLLGSEVVNLFELQIKDKGFYNSYNNKIDATIANAFSSAAYRFGHSMVQNSYIRVDSKFRRLLNNVSLHEEADNLNQIWSRGAIDRLILGLCTQSPQRRDEFICNELSNHLFQQFDTPFGMDLGAINIQRGRDHGIPPYVVWRKPCGLSEINSWKDLEKLFEYSTVLRFRDVYLHVEDIDLFSGGLAEKNVRGGIVGPTFACIIAQQFLNLRQGDRFWYENGGFDSSFTTNQLREIKKVTLAKVLCKTLEEIDTIQPYVMMAPDELRNSRIPCDSPFLDDIDLSPWIDDEFHLYNNLDFRHNFLRIDDE